MKKSLVSTTLLAMAVLLAAPLPATAQAEGQDPHHPQEAPGAAASPESPAPGTTGAPGEMGIMEIMPQGMMPGDSDMPMAGSETMDCPMMARSEEHTSELKSLMRISYA